MWSSLPQRPQFDKAAKASSTAALETAILRFIAGLLGSGIVSTLFLWPLQTGSLGPCHGLPRTEGHLALVCWPIASWSLSCAGIRAAPFRQAPAAGRRSAPPARALPPIRSDT